MKFIQKIKNFLSPEDLTKGNITKNIILFTIPIIISLIFQQIYSLTDAIIAGQNLNANEIAGINDSGSITFIFLDFAFGCTSGFSALTAKAKGANDENAIKKSFSIQIVLGFFIAIILTVVSIVFKDVFLSMINVNQGSQVYESASTYLVIIFIGIIAQLFYNLFSNILRSIGDSITPLIVLISSCLLNIILDLLFMVTFKWGVAGAAWATIISQFLCGIACFIYCYKRYSFFHIKMQDLRIDWKYASEHLKNGIPLGLQFSILAIGIIVMQGAVVNFDLENKDPLNPAQLGYGAANKYLGAIMSIPNAIGTTMLSFTGQNYGAKQFGRIKEGIKKSLILSISASTILIIITLLLCINGTFLKMFLSPANIDDLTIKYGTFYYFANSLFFFTLGILFIGRGVFQGLQKPFIPFILGVIELIVRFVICLYGPKIISPDDLTSDIAYLTIMSADSITWLACAIVILICFITKIFKNPEYKDIPTTINK